MRSHGRSKESRRVSALQKLYQGSSSPYLSLGQLWLYCRPGLTLGSITQKVHHNRALGYSLIDLEEVGSGNPSIILSLFPRCAIFSDANDDIQSVITKIEPLAMALRAVTNECECVVLEVILLKRLARLSHPLTQLYVFAQSLSLEKKSRYRAEAYQKLFPGPILTFYRKVSVDQPNSSPDTSFPP